MEQIVKSISRLKGVHDVALYHDGEVLASTFDADKSDRMFNSAEILAQIFSALEAIGQSHNEIYFSVGKYYLAAFLLAESHVALLVTDKKINYPLIGMGIKSASEKIARNAKEQVVEPVAVVAQEGAQSTSVAVADIPTEEAHQHIYEQLSSTLMDYLGPAAGFVVEDCIALWKKKYIQSAENLPHLIELIQNEISDDVEKEQFAMQANAILEQG